MDITETDKGSPQLITAGSQATELAMEICPPTDTGVACGHLRGSAFGTFFSKDPPGQGLEQAASILLWEEKAGMQVFKRNSEAKALNKVMSKWSAN